MIHVDSNIILDVLRPNPDFVARSEIALKSAPDRVVGPIVYAEVATGFSQRSDVDAALLSLGLSLVAIGEDALFAAAQAHFNYRRRGGPRTSILSDFFVGAHALVNGCPLLTRDAARYRTAYPALQLIAP